MSSGKDRVTDASFGIRSENGEWRPPYPCTYAPIFQWPWKPLKVLKWLFGFPGFIWPWHLGYVLLATLSWMYLIPGSETCKTLSAGWILLMLLRNLVMIALVYGAYHLALYTLKLHGSDRKYHPKWQEKGSAKFLFKNQVWDNMFRTCVVGATTWTAYEVLYLWLTANGHLTILEWSRNPVWFVALFFLIPLWRETHFYLVHRLIHIKPLMRAVHSVHHKNPNPGPWSGLAMHPVETILYFSVVLIHFVVPSHPVHFFFNSMTTALSPANGHHGFEGPLFGGKLITGSYFHYLHHRYVSCNFGETTVPLDKWFGRFYDGTGPYTTKGYTGNEKD